MNVLLLLLLVANRLLSTPKISICRTVIVEIDWLFSSQHLHYGMKLAQIKVKCDSVIT